MKLKKKYSLKEISSIYNCTIIGNELLEFDSVSSLSSSKKNSLIYISDPKYLPLIDQTKINCIITTKEIGKLITASSISLIIHENPLLLFSEIINESIKISDSSLFSDVPASNKISETALIGKNVVIGNNVIIGDNTIIYPNVIIYDETVIGDNVTIHSGSTIGSDGFGLVKNKDQWFKVPHIGNVVIDNNVEIGANSTIDRGTLDSTMISNNVKIDNHVHIAHNVFIGENTAIAACVGIAGSTSIGKNCIIGGGAGINGHISITDNVHIHGMTMVTKSITEQGMYASGTTVEPVASWRKNQARFKELDSLAKIIKKKT
jgi:UDP-3-O-[3-hydroxymyristoyl] glucosamine N-acyltransferase